MKKTRIQTFIASAFCAAFLAGAASAQNSMNISFPGYQNSNAPVLTNFPVLLNFIDNIGDAGYLMKDAQFSDPDAFDLRFYDESNNLLDYEIDTFIPSGPDAQLVVWLKIPELKPDGSTVVFASWGDDTTQLPCTENGDVWNGGYLFVQHYNETNATDAVADSTAAKRPAAYYLGNAPTVAGRVPGAIGNSLALSPSTTTSGVRMNPPVEIGAEWTVSAWFKGLKENTSANSWRTLTRASPNSGQHHIIVEDRSNRLGAYSPNNMGIYNGGNFPTGAFYQAPNALLERDFPQQEWRHIFVIGGNGTTKYFINGALRGDTANFQAIQNIEGVGANLAPSSTASQQFADFLDEFRVAGVARSEHWAWAEFENQKPGSVFAFYDDSQNDSRVRITGNPTGVGNSVPPFGLQKGLVANQPLFVEADAVWTNPAANKIAVTEGWEVFAFDSVADDFVSVAAGTGTSFTYIHPDPAAEGKIVWNFAVSNKVSVSFGAGGSVSPAMPEGYAWCGEYDSLLLTAEPAVPNVAFYKWVGDVPDGADPFKPALVLPGDKPRAVEAVFKGAQYVATAGDGGSDSNGGTSWMDAKETIQAAIAELVANNGGEGVVLVSNGVYAVQSEIAVSSAITVRGASGVAEDVVVRRDWDFVTRVFNINHANARVEFITISDGYLNAYNGHGGNFFINTAGGTVADCVVRNGRVANGYSSGGNIYMNSANAYILRCVVTNGVSGGNSNGGGGGGVRIDNGRVESCLIENNSDNGSGCGSGVMMNGAGIVANCTIVRNRSNWGAAVNANAGQVVNCVIADNTAPDNSDPANGGTVFSGAAQAARFQNCVADVYINPSCFTAASPGAFGFVDRTVGDYRLTPFSPAIDRGSSVALASGTDLEGNPRVVNGKADAGCYEYQSNGGGEGGSGGGAFDFHFEALGELRRAVPLVVVFTGAVVNASGAVDYIWDFGDGTAPVTTQAPTVSHTYLTPSESDYTVTATATNKATGAYVTRTRDGFHAAPGFIHVAAGADAADYPFDSWETALPSLSAAYTYADEGTEIIMSNGVYNVTAPQETAVFVISKNVTIRGFTGNPDDVTISGPGWRVQLMVMNHPQARIEHISLRGGDAYRSAYLAGNLHIGPLGGIASNCVIYAGQNSHGDNAGSGGVHIGGRDALVTHSVIRDNTVNSGNTVAGGVQISAGRLENCLIAGNSTVNGSDSNRKAGGLYMTGGSVVNCTIAGNTSRNYGGLYATGGVLTNTVIAWNTSTSYSINPEYIEPNTWGGSISAAAFVNCATDNSSPVNPSCYAGSAQELLANVVAKDYYPAAASPLIDNGFAFANTPQSDLAGNEREQGGGIDIGCYESDPDMFVIAFSADNIQSLAPTQTVFKASVSGAVDVEDLVFYWDFNGDGATDLVTTELCVTNQYPVGGYFTVTLVATNSAPSLPAYLAAEKTIKDYLHYSQKTLYVAPENPTAAIPYNDWNNAAATINEAVKFAVDGCEIILGDGEHTAAGQLFINKDLRIRSDSGVPESAVIRAPGGANYALVRFNHPAAKLSGVTLHGGTHGFAGGNLDFDVFGGTVSNCVIRNGFSHGFHGNGAAAYMSSQNALITHSVITNNFIQTSNDNQNAHKSVIVISAGRIENSLIAHNGFYETAYSNRCTTVTIWNGSLVNCTVAGNTANRNGIVAADANAIITNCVIAGNTRLNDAPFVEGAGGAARIFSSTVDVEIANPSCEISSPNVIFKDWLKGNYQLGAGSPAIDHGELLAPLQIAALPAFDLLGRPRVTNNRIDDGCYESKSRMTTIIVR